MPRPETREQYIQNLKRIYNSFEVKDLTQGEFIRQMLDLNDPKKIMDDLGDMQLQKARERMSKIRINKALN